MEATNLIDFTLKEIAKGYVPGTLKWTKKTQPARWGKLVATEREINLAAGAGDPRAFKKSLESYQKLVAILCEEFKGR